MTTPAMPRRILVMHAAPEALAPRTRLLFQKLGYSIVDPDELAANLPFGVKRLVEIARALARHPAVLLLDEPAAGLSQEEILSLATLIARIRAAGTAVLLVGHHMDLMMTVSDEITVLNHGRRIAQGPPSSVQRDPTVIEALCAALAEPAPAQPESRVPTSRV